MGPPGHLAIGFVAKPLAPKVPLWVLLATSMVLDLLSFGFEAIGLEDFGVSKTDITNGLTVILPGKVTWSHGLFMSLVWSILIAAIAYLIFKDRRSSAVLGLVAFSHWVLDFIVHPGELPLLFEGSPMVGLGLWTSGAGLIFSATLEVVLLAGGVAFFGSHENDRSFQDKSNCPMSILTRRKR